MDDSKNNNNLIWIDLEMTGLDTVNDEIIEVRLNKVKNLLKHTNMKIIEISKAMKLK